MLTIEIKVNGSVVALIQAANVSNFDAQPSVYEAEGFIFSFRRAGVPTPSLMWSSNLKHKRERGMLRLAAALLNDAVEKTETA